jgi:hypothetical protein
MILLGHVKGKTSAVHDETKTSQVWSLDFPAAKSNLSLSILMLQSIPVNIVKKRFPQREQAYDTLNHALPIDLADTVLN